MWSVWNNVKNPKWPYSKKQGFKWICCGCALHLSHIRSGVLVKTNLMACLWTVAGDADQNRYVHSMVRCGSKALHAWVTVNTLCSHRKSTQKQSTQPSGKALESYKVRETLYYQFQRIILFLDRSLIWSRCWLLKLHTVCEISLEQKVCNCANIKINCHELY